MLREFRAGRYGRPRAALEECAGAGGTAAGQAREESGMGIALAGIRLAEFAAAPDGRSTPTSTS